MTDKPVRKWVPSAYVDEVTPPPRATPSDWIVRLDDGALALDRADELDEDSAPRVLNDGDEIQFDWIEHFDSVEFTVAADGTWSVDPQPAPEAEQFHAYCEPESMMDGLDEFAAEWIGNDPSPTTETLICYRWAPADVPHVFRDGAFHAAGLVQP